MIDFTTADSRFPLSLSSFSGDVAKCDTYTFNGCDGSIVWRVLVKVSHLSLGFSCMLSSSSQPNLMRSLEIESD